MNLQEANNHLDSKRGIVVYPDIFEDNYGYDIEIPTKEKILITKPSWKKKGKRRVWLEVSTWRGISSNAVHFYGTLKIEGVDIIYKDNDQISTYVDEHKYPFADDSYDFKIMRTLTEEEIKRDTKRWEDWDVGDRTNCFETKKELIELSSEIFKIKFSGEWELWLRDINRKESKII